MTRALALIGCVLSLLPGIARAEDGWASGLAFEAAVGVTSGLVLSRWVGDSEQPSRWTLGDTALELTFATFQVIDVMQTTRALRDGLRELNPFLGEHPSQLKLDAFFVGGLVVHAAVARLLPHPWRTVWQTVGIAVEADTVRHNFGVHAGLSLPW